MSNRFIGKGNLGKDAVLKHIEQDGRQQPIAECFIYFDRPVVDDDDQFSDKGGFWLPVELWGERAESWSKFLLKGVRVRVEGTLVGQPWQNQLGSQVSYVLKAKDITLDLARIESVIFKPKIVENELDSARPQTDQPSQS